MYECFRFSECKKKKSNKNNFDEVNILKYSYLKFKTFIRVSLKANERVSIIFSYLNSILEYLLNF